MLFVDDGISIRELHAHNMAKPIIPGCPKRWFEPGSVESIHEDNSVDVIKNNVTDPFLTRPIRKPFMFARSFASKSNLQTIPQKASLPHLGSVPNIDSEHRISVPDQLNNLEKEAIGDFMSHSMHSIDKDDDAGSNWNVMCRWLTNFFDLTLLRDKVYVNILFGMSISIFAEINFAILTPFILTDLSFNANQISIILFTMAIADLVSRFCSPFIADQLNLSIRWSYVISLTLLVITRSRKCFMFCLFHFMQRFNAFGSCIFCSHL